MQKAIFFSRCNCPTGKHYVGWHSQAFCSVGYPPVLSCLWWMCFLAPAKWFASPAGTKSFKMLSNIEVPLRWHGCGWGFKAPRIGGDPGKSRKKNQEVHLPRNNWKNKIGATATAAVARRRRASGRSECGNWTKVSQSSNTLIVRWFTARPHKLNSFN